MYLLGRPRSPCSPKVQRRAYDRLQLLAAEDLEDLWFLIMTIMSSQCTCGIVSTAGLIGFGEDSYIY